MVLQKNKSIMNKNIGLQICLKDLFGVNNVVIRITIAEATLFNIVYYGYRYTSQWTLA